MIEKNKLTIGSVFSFFENKKHGLLNKRIADICFASFAVAAGFRVKPEIQEQQVAMEQLWVNIHNLFLCEVRVFSTIQASLALYCHST